MPRGIFIGDIPFFTDYFIYLKAKKAAKTRGIKYRYYIVECIQDYLNSVHTPVYQDKSTLISVNTPERLWDACNTRAIKENTTIAALIEKAVATKLGEYHIPTITTPTTTPVKRGSFLDLNRDIKPK